MHTLQNVNSNFLIIASLFKKMNSRANCAKLTQNQRTNESDNAERFRRNQQQNTTQNR